MNNKLILATVLSAAATLPAVASDFSGTIMGLNLGYLGLHQDSEFSTEFGVDPDNVAVREKRDYGTSQMVTGGHVGWGKQMGPAYLGGEVVMDSAAAKTNFSVKATAIAPVPSPAAIADAAAWSNSVGRIKSNLGGGLFLRGGVAMGNALLGAKAGYGFRKFKYSHLILFNAPNVVQSRTIKKTGQGPAFGVFAEAKVTDSFLAGAEGNVKLYKRVQLKNTANATIARVKTSEVDFRVRLSYLLGAK